MYLMICESHDTKRNINRLTRASFLPALKYDGSGVVIEVRQLMLMSFKCPIDPLAFPFDVQVRQ